MQAWSSKFSGVKALARFAILHFAGVEKEESAASTHHL
jgi:hypothetical protein